MCCQPTKLILGFLFLKFSHFSPPPPPSDAPLPRRTVELLSEDIRDELDPDLFEFCAAAEREVGRSVYIIRGIIFSTLIL